MEVLQRLGYSINYPEALRLFGSVDTNQDGKIRVEEFIDLYITLKTTSNAK
jgi:Ca2+-binding EF-hand superfamily protein